jgi:anthranilate phosphoribosyltransferase
VTAQLEQILQRRHLAEQDAADLLSRLIAEDVAPALAGAVLAALRAKGETADELRGFTRAMRALARRPVLPQGGPLVDTCGTGGDGSLSVNLSTGTALLAAACGVRVVKHGNRSVSSRAGSADVLEALGLELPLADAAMAGLLARTGFTFLFAPHYHPAMKVLAPVRRALGVRTIFNLLGPLSNPAEPPFQLIGAFSQGAAALIAETLSGLPVERAFVVHGACGWDEATPVGPFVLFDVHHGRVTRTIRDPRSCGVPLCSPDALAGGSAAHNAARLAAALGGERGAHRDALVLGAALVLELTGACPDPRQGARRAGEAIDDGRAARVIAALREVPRAA